MSLTRHSMRIAGILLLTVVAVELGGLYLIGASSYAGELTDFQLNFSRAGHAHAGMLVTLSLVMLVWADGAGLHGPAGWVARLGVPAAAILMSVGFFVSSAGSGRTEPNGLIALVWLGGLCLAAGVVTLGVSLLRAGLSRDRVPER